MGMDNDISRARTDALVFLKRHKTAVLATASLAGEPHASMVFYVADNNFGVHFITRIDSRKYEAIKANPHVALTVATADIPQTLQIEGIATDISQNNQISSMKPELFEVLQSNHWFYAPITKLDPSSPVEIRIEPTWIRWADYAFEQDGNEHVFKEIPVLG